MGIVIIDPYRELGYVGAMDPIAQRVAQISSSRAERASGIYHCRVISGSGTASAGLAPMLDAWSSSRGISLHPGTFNLAADRFVMIAHGPGDETLNGKRGPRHQQAKEGYAPRLYRVTLDGAIMAWLFRWCEPPYLRNFVGPQPGKCEHPDRFCEIVSEKSLRAQLGSSDGQAVTLWFGWEANDAHQLAEERER